MPWTLTSYLDRRAKEIPNPKAFVFGTMFFAFAAGAQFVDELEEGRRTPLGIALSCIMIGIWPASSLECAYLLLRSLRAVRR